MSWTELTFKQRQSCFFGGKDRKPDTIIGDKMTSMMMNHWWWWWCIIPGVGCGSSLIQCDQSPTTTTTIQPPPWPHNTPRQTSDQSYNLLRERCKKEKKGAKHCLVSQETLTLTWLTWLWCVMIPLEDFTDEDDENHISPTRITFRRKHWKYSEIKVDENYNREE